MTQFMEGGAVPIDRFKIRARRRYLHEIARRVVVGACATDAEIRAGGGDQGLRLRLDLARRRRNNRSGHVFGQAVPLVGVEDGEAFEEWDRARLLPGLRGAAALVLRRGTGRQKDRRSAFAPPHSAPETDR